MKKPKYTKPTPQKPPQKEKQSNRQGNNGKGNGASMGESVAENGKGLGMAGNGVIPEVQANSVNGGGKHVEFSGMGSLKPVNGLVYYQNGKPMAVSAAPDATARELEGLARESTRATSPRARKKYRKKMFLLAYGMTANATIAAVRAGIDRSTAYKWCDADPEFAREWKERGDQAIDLLEFACWNRAVNGTERPIWMKDKDGNPALVGTMTEYSDKLAELLLSANRPGKYRKNVDVTSAGQQINPTSVGTVQIVLPSNGRENLPALQNPIDIESENQAAPQNQGSKDAGEDPQGSPS